MGMESFFLYGHNTAETMAVGCGPQAMRHWSLPQFPGPDLWTHGLGLAERRRVYLPLDLLLLLYERFYAANPDGLAIMAAGEVQSCPVRTCLTGTGPERGYPQLRRYLPELFDLRLLREIAADPWLDAQLLAEVAPLLPAGEECWGVDAQGQHVISPLGRSERWWPQWRAYCEALECGEAMEPDSRQEAPVSMSGAFS
ncbi:MAG TPA: hypothetical protein VFL86_00335 [Burkholderiaceae bacterium]|nr:hypothetical protein [Burkholderiaceae bacterium]